MPLTQYALTILILVATMPLTVGFMMRFRFRTPYGAPPEVRPLEVESLDPDAAAFFAAQEAAFVALGFGEATRVRLVGQSPSVSSASVVLVNRRTGDQAFAHALAVTGRGSVRTCYVEIATRFDSGERFATTNLPWLSPDTGAVHTQVPSVGDAETLYRLHQFVVARDGPPGTKLFGEPARNVAETHGRLVEGGRIALDPRDGVYYYTLKGAVVRAFLTLPPYSFLWLALMRRRGRRVLRDFGRADNR